MSANSLDRIHNITQHHDEAGWLLTNAASLLDDFTIVFRQGGVPVSAAVSGLLLVYPYVIHYHDVKQWSNLLQVGLMAYERQFPRPIMHENTSASQFFLTDHEGDEVIEAEFAVALKRARKRIRPAMILQAYTNLLRKYVYHEAEHFNPRIIVSALSLGRQVNEQPAYGLLHLTLAYTYAQLGHFDKGLQQANTAYHYWRETREEYETALSLYAVATLLNRQGDFEAALPWFEQAERAFLDLNRPRYRGYIAYEMSKGFLAQRDFPNAHKWATTGLKEIIRTETDYPRAVFEYWFGVTTTRINQYEDAKTMLETSMRYWRGRHDHRFMSLILSALALLEGCRGNFDEAQRLADEAAELIASLPASGEKDDLLSEVTRLRGAIQNREDLTTY